MKDRVVVALLTVLIFGAGLGVGFWAARQRAVPPPPMPFMGEFSGGRGLYAGATAHEPVDRAQLAAEIQRLDPQIKFYRAHLQEIDADFEQDLRHVLRPDQQAIRDESMKRRAEEAMQRASERDAGKPLADDEILRLQQPSMRLFRMTVITRDLDQMTQELKLDPAQRAAVLHLLVVRRDSFLTLVDSVSPPSVVLSRLAAQAQRLAQPGPGP
jgi:hypothetical protein